MAAEKQKYLAMLESQQELIKKDANRRVFTLVNQIE